MVALLAAPETREDNDLRVGIHASLAKMAEALGALHVDLDELHWLPGWQERPGDEMVAMLAEQLAAAPGGRWVVSGNYTRFVGSYMRAAATALRTRIIVPRATRPHATALRTRKIPKRQNE